LYLLTFIVAFSPRPLLPFWLVEKVFPYVSFAAIVLISMGPDNFILQIILNLVCFYLIAQMCHNRLAKDRPPAESLTEFYFFMSLGGVIGGALTALAAPLIFNDVYEYQLVIAIGGLVAIGAMPKGKQLWRDVLLGLAALAILTAYVMNASQLPDFVRNVALLSFAVAMVAGVHLFRSSPVRLFIILLATAILTVNIQGIFLAKGERIIYSDRIFFGVSKVIYNNTDNGPVHIFQHGNTKHNVQLRTQEALDYPLAYYSPEGSFGQAVDAVRAQKRDMSVAVVGLGAGAMACHVRENESWKFYEIDPLVIEMARTQELFTYVNNCAPNSPIVTGDARLTLQQEPAAKFDLIMIDAFSSDAIPAHLVTKEALELYRSKLKQGGYIFFHTSNRNLDVSSVVLNVAEVSGLASRFISSKPDETIRYHEQVSASNAILVGDDEASLNALLRDYPDWEVKKGSNLVGVWRDDFSHIIGALLANAFEDRK
ncbi:MAG: fused MFS/spermidine synthase, partial [Pseudomonadota bacterium]